MVNQPISRSYFLGKVVVSIAGLAVLSCTKTPRWQTGCFTRPWAEHDYRDAFDGIAGAGFKYAGLMSFNKGPIITKDTTPEQAVRVGEEAKSRGLEIVSLWGGNFGSEKSVDEGIAGLRQLIDNSVACGCNYIVLGGAEKESVEENYYKAIAESCDYAEDNRVFLTLKPHGPLNSTGTECRSLIESINHTNFRLWYDPGNIYYYSDGNLDPVNDAAVVDNLVVGMSVKDFRMPKDVDVTPGTGMVDFAGVISRLKQGGFNSGPLVIECLAKGDLSFINSEAAKARKFIEDLL